MARVLLVGESWTVETTHVKGFDAFSSRFYEQGGEAFVDAVTAAGHDVEWLPSHRAQARFPDEEGLRAWDVVVLSDIGSNTLLLHPDAYLHGRRAPNRLVALREWVRTGGALAMCGGYYSFQGIHGFANYRRTPVADALPVELDEGDDRVEKPEGVVPRTLEASHPTVTSVSGEWPYLLGYNRVRAKTGATVVAAVDDDPLLVCGEFGSGRALAWTSDIAPHWCPEPFLEWAGYARLWQNAVAWLSGEVAPT